MRLAIACAMPLVAVVILPACGNSDNARTGFINDYCELWRPCCQTFALRDDGAECRLNLASYSADGFDSEAAESCLAEMRAASGAPSFCGTFGLTTGACGRVFPTMGAKAPGETCSDAFDCAAPAADSDRVTCTQENPPRSDLGTCQVWRPGQLGDSPCIGTVVDSFLYFRTRLGDVAPLAYLCGNSDGLYCHEEGACAPLATSGTTCQSSIGECAPGLYCDLVGSGICLERHLPGGDCSYSDQCTSETYCSAPDFTCTARLADGASCETFEACLSARCVGGVCRPRIRNPDLFVVCEYPDV